MMRNFADRLEKIKKDGVYRSLKRSSVCGADIEIDGARYANFASNDYLGISGRVDWQREFLESVLNGGEKGFLMGSVSSRLLGCNSEAFFDFESFMAKEYSDISESPKSCLLFNCGYHANSGIIPALASSRDLILADKLSHASIIDSLKLTEAKWLRYPHNDYEKLGEILSKKRGDFENVFIVSEAVFSMDGDFCDIEKLVEIKRKYGAFLYVDEAHSFGLFGEKGLGRCAESGLLSDIDIVMCTLGKALASGGAFAVCAPETREMLVNKCRTFIFSTALSPLSAKWSKFAAKKMFSMDSERRRLAGISSAFRNALKESLGDSQIVPAIVGGNEESLALSKAMLENGFYVPAIRHPTVPKNAARLRFSLSAAHSEESLERAAELFNRFAGRTL
jgi:hypothetical protein